MADLNQFLRYIDRDGVDALVLASDQPASLQVSGNLRPLTRASLSTRHLQSLTRGTAVAALVARKSSGKEVIELGGKSFEVEVAWEGEACRLTFKPASPSGLRATRSEFDEQGGAVAQPRSPAARQTRPAQQASTTPTRGAMRRSSAETGEMPRADPGRSRPAADRNQRTPAAARTPTRSQPAATDPSPRPAAARPSKTPGSRPSPAAAARPTPAPAAAPAPAASPAPARPAPVQGPTVVDAALTRVLAEARKSNASDVHIVSDRPALIRVAGELVAQGQPIPRATVETMLESLLSSAQAARLEEVGYVDLGIHVKGAGRLRVNVGHQRTGLKGSFRLVADHPPSLESLGLPSELAKVTQYHQGLAIISGPNGQGKTTTMAALVDKLNAERPLHILVIEDPVEIQFPVRRAVVSQREVGAHTASFARALKAALREDPDVIVIGELRDRETVEMALSAAETGHLVIATMSTPSGAKTIDRLIDMFPPDDQAQVRATLAGALKIVVSQRLIPRQDGRGMVAAAELITGNIPLWALIRDNKLFQLPSLLQRGRAYGFIRIEDSIRGLLEQGLVTKEQALRYVDDPRSLDPKPTPATGQDSGVPKPARDENSGIAARLGNFGKVFGKK